MPKIFDFGNSLHRVKWTILREVRSTAYESLKWNSSFLNFIFLNGIFTFQERSLCEMLRVLVSPLAWIPSRQQTSLIEDSCLIALEESLLHANWPPGYHLKIFKPTIFKKVSKWLILLQKYVLLRIIVAFDSYNTKEQEGQPLAFQSVPGWGWGVSVWWGLSEKVWEWGNICGFEGTGPGRWIPKWTRLKRSR